MDELTCVTGKELDEAIAKSNIPRSRIEAAFPQLDQHLGIGEKMPVAASAETLSADQPSDNYAIDKQ